MLSKWLNQCSCTSVVNEKKNASHLGNMCEYVWLFSPGEIIDTFRLFYIRFIYTFCLYTIVFMARKMFCCKKYTHRTSWNLLFLKFSCCNKSVFLRSVFSKSFMFDSFFFSESIVRFAFISCMLKSVHFLQIFSVSYSGSLR